MISLSRQDGTDVSLPSLMTKMLGAAQASQDDEHSQLCGQEAMRLIAQLQHVPLVTALFHLNQEIGTILTIFFRIGYMLGRAVDANDLTIKIEGTDDDSSSANSESNATNGGTHSN